MRITENEIDDALYGAVCAQLTGLELIVPMSVAITINEWVRIYL